jgi:3-deoxy-7-phosphoheptulonate synthase
LRKDGRIGLTKKVRKTNILRHFILTSPTRWDTERAEQTLHLLIDHQNGSSAAKRTVDRIRDWALSKSFAVKAPRGSGMIMDRVMWVGLPEGEAHSQWIQELAEMEGVLAVSTGKDPLFKVVDPSQTDALVTLGDAKFGKGYTSLIAGPCSVEEYEPLLQLAEQLKSSGATALRAGAYKPRTSPYAFGGQAEEGLKILAEVSARTGLSVVTEVLDPGDVELVAEHAHTLQIGSRNMGNGALLRAAGGVGSPVLLKRGMSATLSEFLHAAEFLADAGCRQIILCERGLRHFDHDLRNLLDLSAIPALQMRTHLPVVVDPSHGTGRADLVPTMMVAAAAAGADGLLVEVHENPPQSVSDAHQTISVPTFQAAVKTVGPVLQAIGRNLVTSDLESPLPTS